MTLRAEPSQTAQGNSPHLQPGDQAPTARILYLRDDSSANAPLVTKLLHATKPFGTTLQEVSNKDEFLRAFQLHSWDLIIVDHSSGSPSGEEALHICSSVAPDIPVIVLGHSPAEEALRTSEEKYRLLFENMSEMFQILEPILDDQGKVVDFRYLEISRATEKLVGKSRKEIEGKTAKELWGIVEDHWLELLEKVLRTGEPSHLEDYSGELDKYYNIHAWRLNESRIAIIFADITERKRAEKALETTNQKINEILLGIEDDFYVLDREWKFVYANRNFASRIGKKPEDLLGKNLWEVFSRHLGTAYEENLRAAMAKREIREFELRGQYSDAWYHMKVYPSTEGITLINHDITERKRVEEALKRSQAQYKELVESSNSVILRSDKDLNILFMNQYGLRFFGYSVEELIGKNVVGTILPDRGSAGEDLAAMADDLRRHPDRYRTNVHQNRRKDGSLVWMSWTNKAIFDEAGNLIEGLAIGNDLTQLMEAEVALKASQENLRLMISQASDAMMIVDAYGVIEAVSPLGSRLLGYDERELIGKTASQFAETFSRLEVALRLEDLHRQAPRPLATSLRIKTKDGARFMNLSVRLLNCGTASEKYFMKFSKLDLPSPTPDAAPGTL